MSVLTLGTHRLPAAEVALIRSLIRLFAHTPSFRWRFVESGPCDAVIVDATLSEAPVAEVAKLARVVLKVTRHPAADAPDTLQRPIRADKLRAWLERQVPESRQAQALAPVGETLRAARTARHIRFKLRRWPSAALLKNDPQRIRLATLLARRALGPLELSSISQLPHEQCLEFVDALRQAGLVEMQEAPGIAPAASTTAASPRASAKPPFAHGLITGIRRHLGL